MKSSRTAGPRDPNDFVSFAMLEPRSTHTVRVLHWLNLGVVVQVVEERSKDLPGCIELILEDLHSSPPLLGR